MKEYLKLAWRNIWRNKRRTLITIASVFFAMFFALIMRSLQIGSYSQMTQSIVGAFTGYLQIHKNGYWDDKTLDYTFENREQLVSDLENNENIATVIPRLESFALASAGEQTKGIMVVGIDPEKEKGLTHPDKNIISGEYLTDESSGVMVSKRLAEFLNLSLADTITLLSQGYHGATAAGIFPVTAIIKLPNPEMDRRLVYMNINTAQEFYGAYNMLTALVINVNDQNLLQDTKQKIAALSNGGEYEVMDWKELNPELVQQIQSDQYGGYIMLGVLYLIVGFGVLGTLVMMTTERRREFAVMVSVGMQKTKLGFILVFEMLLMGLSGIVTALIGSMPVILLLIKYPIKITGDLAKIFETYGFEPIMPASLESSFIIGQSVVVLVIFFLAIIYPAISVFRINETKALRA
jgi:ABC-type lipoprotein release transport system permease subunit